MPQPNYFKILMLVTIGESVFRCAIGVYMAYFYHGGTEITEFHGNNSVFLRVLCVSVVNFE